MGNVLSIAPTRGRDAENVMSESDTLNCENSSQDMEEQDERNPENPGDGARAKAKEAEMDEFRKQLTIKREQRKEILARHRTEKEELEKSLQSERTSKLELYESNRQLRELLMKHNVEIPDKLQSNKETSELTDAVIQIRDDFEKMKSNTIKLRRDLADANNALQSAYSDIADLNSQNTESIKQISALREVVTISKTMISLREEQLNNLKNKLDEIERTLGDKETNLLSADLKKEYVRQLQNIRTLRGLYEERARLAEVTRQGLARELDEHKVLYQAETNKNKDLAAKVDELESKVETLEETVENKNSQISSCQDETKGLKAEMAVVNKLFSQVLLGYKTKRDLDQLVHRLEENHGLLTQMAEQDNGSEASSALPKLLLELVSQVDANEENKYIDKQTTDVEIVEEQGELATEAIGTANSQNTTAEEIVENLPKVWRVLMELLSHQSVAEVNSCDKVTTCYKSVETKSGPVLVPSVSQTYIRLKDLIVEKLGLVKEVNRIKQLNSHLETRLGEQERRLCLVTSELSKTWHVVGRLRRHHHQLHTHEKILKYELQQKRKLLNELKEELAYCREKWEQAREKNSQSERDWKTLRAEFSSRKTKTDSISLNNSAESGYSDERLSDESSESNDESEYVADHQVRCKKKLKKSFETILDSSTDFNPAAEREDPASDMIDVADLPLDAQDGDDNQLSDYTRSDNVPKHEKVCEETEDEVCEITHDDLCTELCTSNNTQQGNNMSNVKPLVQEVDFSVTEENTDNAISVTSAELAREVLTIDPEQILRDVKQQNERLAKKDEKLEHLEKSSAEILNKARVTAKLSEQINKSLDILINQPTSSNHVYTHDTVNKIENSMLNVATKEITVPENIEINSEIDCEKESNITNIKETLTNSEKNHTDKELNDADASFQCQNLEGGSDIELESSISISTTKHSDDDNEINSNVPVTDFKAILESIKHQNERLAMKDDRLKKLEGNCSDVVKRITNTLNTGEEISKKLDILHQEHEHPEENSYVDIPENDSNEEPSLTSTNTSEPSTSNEIDHEARFAARDIRLKRLEEQTKSLVNKVNKTTTKGVKIHYKLEELHNIYGSESSRAGTPSEDDDRSKEEDPNTETEE